MWVQYEFVSIKEYTVLEKWFITEDVHYMFVLWFWFDMDASYYKEEACRFITIYFRLVWNLLSYN